MKFEMFILKMFVFLYIKIFDFLILLSVNENFVRSWLINNSITQKAESRPIVLLETRNPVPTVNKPTILWWITTTHNDCLKTHRTAVDGLHLSPTLSTQVRKAWPYLFLRSDVWNFPSTFLSFYRHFCHIVFHRNRV